MDEGFISITPASFILRRVIFEWSVMTIGGSPNRAKADRNAF
jgi:hypothetical protein